MPAAAVVLTTLPDRRSADRLASALVRQKLAACVSVLGPVRSVYRWKGRVERAREMLLVVKTARSRCPALERFVRRNHPYEVPEVLCLPVTRGSSAYLSWLGAAVA